LDAGYTGTLICVDPVSSIATVLLTNRVYPNHTSDNFPAIQQTRQAFNNAVLKVVGSFLKGTIGMTA
jgi:CubicO group peptidase (beta-lactamase class C family)